MCWYTCVGGGGGVCVCGREGCVYVCVRVCVCVCVYFRSGTAASKAVSELRLPKGKQPWKTVRYGLLYELWPLMGNRLR